MAPLSSLPTLPDLRAPLLEWAQWYARLGWPVFPMHTPDGHGGCSCREGTACTKPGKHPRTMHGRNDASTSPQTIIDWWMHWPDAPIAVKTNGLFIVDVDHRNGGLQSLYQLEKHYGKLPECPRVISGSNSDHYYYGLPTDGVAVYSSDSAIAPGIDIKAFNGNINVPPSLHASGRQYVWDDLFSLDAFPLTAPPQWLVDLARQARPVQVQRYDAGVVILEGGRYHYLISQAGRFRYAGFSEEQIYAALVIANQNCQPPEDEKTLRAYAKWAGRKDMAEPHVLSPPGPPHTQTDPFADSFMAAPTP